MLKIGEKAPNFKSLNQSGEEIELKSFKGKKVILYFYPRDNTPGCTAQACNLRDNKNLLDNQNYVVLGVSSDSEKSHQNFIKKFELNFDLISDEDKSVHKLYGTWVEKNMYGRKYMGTARNTFIIDEDGIITDIITKVKTKEHSNQIISE
ncbi:MAG: thioredoxin-dependent thiol peroxidase [Cytophagales bacterium]|jgi:peroxiredoxin Q/BCP|nr:MAG: thioredoxin-dependent thiol peroxidase [Rhodothermaeota bacterium MED-G19]